MNDINTTLRHLEETSRSYALLCRSEGKGGVDVVELIMGESCSCDRIEEIPANHRVLAAIPYRQAAERGFSCNDDGAKIRVLTQVSHSLLSRVELVAAGAGPISMADPMSFDMDDAHYASVVDAIVKNEIGNGECSNVVISRQLRGRMSGRAQAACLRVFCNLLAVERGFYWAFLIRTPSLTLIGASPEKHVLLTGDRLSMTAISGTARISGEAESSMLQLSTDQKERYELCMVVDEELKMLCRCCTVPPTVSGPALRSMSELVHTEYELHGTSSDSPLELLQKTMFAPTVVGSPLQNAFRVISSYEQVPRSYYSGTLALIEAAPVRALDSVIAIRTCEVSDLGIANFRVGCTITRDSIGVREADEGRSKSAAFQAALNYKPHTSSLANREQDHIPTTISQRVGRSLSSQARSLSKFWIHSGRADRRTERPLIGKSALVVDFEDHSVHMWACILKSLGAQVMVRDYSSVDVDCAADVTILGPGPGNPLAIDEPRQYRVSKLLDELLSASRPTLAVCFAHQILCSKLGFHVRKRPKPNQGLQRLTSWRGRSEQVGFYNTFEARPGAVNDHGATFELSDDSAVDSIALPGVVGIQFHPESILTRNGDILIAEAVWQAMRTTRLRKGR